MANRIAVTGASGNLGRAVVERLLAAPEVDEVVALDRAASTVAHPKLRSLVVDVRDPALGEQLRGCSTVVHLAFVVESGSRDAAAVDAINVGGTKNVVRAALAAAVEHVVYASSIASYGFHADNAGRALDEAAPARGNAEFYYTRTKAEVERWLDEVEAERPGLALARLRPCMFMDPASTRADVLRTPMFVRFTRSDVPIHVAHQADIADAFVLAVRRRARGAFNLAPEDALPLGSWARAIGRRAVPLPDAALRAFELAYARGLGDVDPAWFRFTVQHPIVVTSERARRELGWRPRWPTSGAALRAIVGRPVACASPATRLALGAAAWAGALPGGLGLSAHVQAESRSITGKLNLLLEGPRPSEWHLAIDAGVPRVCPGLAVDSRASVRLSDATFHELLAGRLSWSTAQMTGRVRFHGPGEFAFVPGLLAERFRALGQGEGLRGLPGRALSRWISRRAGLPAVSATEAGR
jgi:nucleoside-diphosphate-sugar epimerase